MDQPDNEYLETMKQRMRGLPDLTKSAANILPASHYDQIDTMDTQEIINRANEVMGKKPQNNIVGSVLQKDKNHNKNSGKSYSLRAIRRKEEVEKKAGGEKEFFNIGELHP